jgi:hypothetical protein
MSKNIVDAVLSLNDRRIGLLPSRRQVDFNGGYAGWNTEQFRNYVGKNVIIERDHAGENQGQAPDDGKYSYTVDSQYMDIIHVDPWKSVTSVEEGLYKTIESIRFIYDKNPACRFEVGTEEAIFPIQTQELSWLLQSLKTELSIEQFGNIEYVVIQSGVKLDVGNEKNIGKFNLLKLKEEVSICNKFGKKTKEHNGDFLSSEERKIRFQCGLSAINIGPELSIFENKLHVESFSDDELRFANNLCRTTGEWKKWVSEDNFIDYFRICGHYNYRNIRLHREDVIDKLRDKILTLVEI